LIPALALIFALIDTPDSGGIVHETELVRALAMGDYLRSHANRLYAAAVIPETTNAATLLVKIKSGKLADRDGVLPDSFTPRQVALKHWAGLARQMQCARPPTCWWTLTICAGTWCRAATHWAGADPVTAI
jgi:putative DNA primase/helicase